MNLSDREIQTLQGEHTLITVARNGGKIDLSLLEPKIQTLQAEQNLLTAARNGRKIDMSLQKSEIRTLQAEQNLLTAARNAGYINLNQTKTAIRRHYMHKVAGRSFDQQELADRDAAKIAITFATPGGIRRGRQDLGLLVRPDCNG